MSETKQAIGPCTEVIQKPGSDWVEFHVMEAGKQYPVRLATKLQPLIELAKVVGSEVATWTYTESESDKINEKSGKPYVNRYLEKVEIGVSPAPTPEGQRAPLVAGDKDRAITRMAVLKAVAELYHGALGSSDVDNDVIILKVMETAGRFEQWVYRDLDSPPF